MKFFRRRSDGPSHRGPSHSGPSRRSLAGNVDLSVSVGTVDLTSPVVLAAGSSGFGPVLARYLDYAQLGAVVAKSLSPFEWAGNPAPRLAPSPGGMLNSVGLENPGATAWRNEYLPKLRSAGATVVASVWGRSVGEFAKAAAQLAGSDIVALEVNASCPNLDDRGAIFAHSPVATSDVVSAVVAQAEVPVWVKLSPNAADLVAISRAAIDAGASALTLINTVLAMGVDAASGQPSLGGGRAGLSGPAIAPVALRAVFDVRAANPDVPIVGTGGISDAASAAALMAAGANAVGMATAVYFDPRAPAKLVSQLARWCADHRLASVSELTDRAHQGVAR